MDAPPTEQLPARASRPGSRSASAISPSVTTSDCASRSQSHRRADRGATNVRPAHRAPVHRTMSYHRYRRPQASRFNPRALYACIDTELSSRTSGRRLTWRLAIPGSKKKKKEECADSDRARQQRPARHVERRSRKSRHPHHAPPPPPGPRRARREASRRRGDYSVMSAEPGLAPSNSDRSARRRWKSASELAGSGAPGSDLIDRGSRARPSTRNS